MKTKVKSNEKLFDKFRDLGLRLQNLGCIVQNDMTLEHYEVSDFISDMNNLKLDIEALKQSVINHIAKCNSKEKE